MMDQPERTLVMHGRAVCRWAACALLLPAVVPVPQAGAQDVPALTRAYNASGVALYRELAGAPGNIVLSPYSIGSALAMARSGARGDTERQMASVLKHSLSRDATDRANAGLLAILNGYDRTQQADFCPKGARWTGTRCEAAPGEGGGCPPSMQPERGTCVGGPAGASAILVAANALLLPKSAGPVDETYKATLRDKYAASVHAGAGAEEINAWVKAKTAGKIDRIVDALDPDAGPVLVSAVYLKAAWASDFPAANTREDDFRLAAQERVRVPTMHQDAELALIERAGYRAIRLDYTERSLAMLVVLPNEGEGIGRVTGWLDSGELAALSQALQRAPRRPVALALPRFKAAFTADLVAPLQKAGMRLPFSDSADFSGMRGPTRAAARLKIAAVKHRAVIEVTEAGTEAAAATSVGMATASAPIERTTPIPFVVDRPFLFFVVDGRSGAILFQGRIADPRRRE
jgi:serpin B